MVLFLGNDKMLVFTIDLFPENKYMKNKLTSACIKRDKELFKNNFKIFTPDDKLVKEAYSFFGKEVVDKRSYATLMADLIRIYILWKLPDALYVDADVFIQKIDLSLLKNKIGTINYWRSFACLSNGGTEEGQNYWKNISEKIKKDLIEDGEEPEKGIVKLDRYYCEMLNIKTIFIEELKMVHFERYILLSKIDFTERKFLFVNYETEIYNILKNLKKNEKNNISIVVLEPDFESYYSYPFEIPMFKNIWENQEDFKKYILEEQKAIIDDKNRCKLVFL